MDLWDLKARKVQRALRQSGGAFLANSFVESLFGFAGDTGRTFLAESHGKVTVWDSESGRNVAQFGLRGYAQQTGWLRFCVGSPDGKSFVVNRGRERVVRVDAVTGKEVWESPHFAERSSCHPVQFAPDGKTILLGLTSYQEKPEFQYTFEILRIDAISGNALADPILLGTVKNKNFDPLTQPQFSKDGRTLMISAGIGPYQTWFFDTASNTVLRKHDLWLELPRLLPDGKKFLGLTTSDAIAICDVQTGKAAREISMGKEGVRSLNVFPAGGRVLLSGSGGLACVWDLE